jgi:hypothetical protein
MNDEARYKSALHAMQTGVAIDLERGSNSATPKHLRVGINAAMCDHAALVRLLVDIGLITYEQHAKYIADEAEREKERY